jgi:hypothetical protein
VVIRIISNYLPVQQLITGFIAKMEDVYYAVRAECVTCKRLKYSYCRMSKQFFFHTDKTTDVIIRVFMVL